MSKKLPRGDTIFWKYNILSQIPFFGKHITLKKQINFLGEDIVTFMSTNYSLKSSFK